MHLNSGSEQGGSWPGALPWHCQESKLHLMLTDDFHDGQGRHVLMASRSSLAIQQMYKGHQVLLQEVQHAPCCACGICQQLTCLEGPEAM